MNKKELRKELELALIKTIEEVLSKKNPDASKMIRKTTFAASKTIAKKFYKSLKEKSKEKVKPAAKSKPTAKPKSKVAVTKQAPKVTKKAKSKK